MRSVLAIVLVLLAGAAAAEVLHPLESEGFSFALTVPAGPGRERYGYVDAVPGTAATWRVTVRCGVHLKATGRVLVEVVGHGTGSRGASPWFGGSYETSDGRKGAYIILQDRSRPDALDLHSEWTGPECPRSGTGQLSSGD
ncbi:hypothetical protein [Methylobacterium sp. J-068]|uniref:hypothetical protein n=1 Tax=Methylobacterium sp. J-068 TaxID=2836649 RepID=UPI001FBAA7A1|nr:hypothetical protein [Methylobacterium sp. J-068]MCJ2035493.1 hypothetical protein [Methylobacterium sp. J-068]